LGEVKLVAVVVNSRDGVISSGYAQYSVDGQSAQGRADAQARAQKERARRDRENVEDAAAFLVSRSKLLAVDAWRDQTIVDV
jgi:hypothetical protein